MPPPAVTLPKGVDEFIATPFYWRANLLYDESLRFVVQKSASFQAIRKAAQNAAWVTA